MLLLRHCLRENKKCELQQQPENQKYKQMMYWHSLMQLFRVYLGIYLAIDKSTDVTDNAQLLVYVRFFTKIRLHEL